MAAQYLQIVSGDAELIAKVCCKTPHPDYCHICIQGDSYRDKEDVKGLARRALSCSGLQSTFVNSDLDNFLTNATDPKLKETLVVCKTYIPGALASVGEAEKSFMNGNYKEASTRLGVSLAQYQLFNEAIEHIYPPISQEFRMNVNKIKGFYQVAISILLQI